MKPKNHKERQSGFLKFLLLFVVTVTMVVIAVFFNYKIPSKENSLLKTQAKAIDQEMQFQNEFSEKMLQVKELINSLDTKGQNFSYQNSLISKELVELQKKIPTKDSTYRYDMYTNVVLLQVELQETKNKLRELEGSATKIKDYETALEKCRQDLKTTERELYIARSSQ